MLDRATFRSRAGGTTVIEILDALNNAKSNAALMCEERHGFGTAIGKGAHTFVGLLAPAKELHVVDDVIEAIGVACGQFQVISGDPNEPVRVSGAASQPIGFLDDEGPQSGFMGR